MNPRELHDTFDKAKKEAVALLWASEFADDEVFMVYRIRDDERTQYGVCSENQFLATSHQWLRDSDIVYTTDEV